MTSNEKVNFKRGFVFTEEEDTDATWEMVERRTHA